MLERDNTIFSEQTISIAVSPSVDIKKWTMQKADGLVHPIRPPFASVTVFSFSLHKTISGLMGQPPISAPDCQSCRAAASYPE